MADHNGLPVAGYRPQGDDKVAAVNVNKELEERLLRRIDALRAEGKHDGRMLALAFTGVQDACMWLNRAIFQPARVKLPEDFVGPEDHQKFVVKVGNGGVRQIKEWRNMSTSERADILSERNAP